MAYVGNFYIHLGGYFRLCFIMAIVGNFLENIIDPMVIIVVDAILMAGCF
jgi:hypothetical protein